LCDDPKALLKLNNIDFYQCELFSNEDNRLFNLTSGVAKMTANTIAKDIKGNWSDIQSKVKSHWKKLSSKDLAEIEGSYTRLIEKVEDAYEFTKEEATEKVHEYIEKLGLSKADVEPDNTLLDKANMAKDIFEKSITDSLGKIKETSEGIHEEITDYVKDNPLKSVGLAILAGVVTGKLWKVVKK
jgi:uncharacterized protein YjbJ (UPF0337 family)